MTATSPDVRLVDLLHVARQQDASDIHLVPGAPAALRIDGDLQLLAGSALSSEETSDIARALFEAEAFSRIEAGSDMSTTRIADDRLVLRVHGFRGAHGINVAIRLLNKQIPTLEALHLPRIVASLAHRDHGLVIFSGPTGSGKSTSLAALIKEINTISARRIITIEDPMRDSETIVLGGLMMDTSSETTTKVPWLADIPILGKIFQNKETAHQRNEIVFLITPHVIYPDPPQKQP